MEPRLLVLQHQHDCPPGWFGEWLEEAGVRLDVLRADQGRAVPAALTEHDGLLVLGGRMGAGDDHVARWLAPARALIATVVAAGTPFLGICLGHQLAALALGGTVTTNPHGRSQGLTPFRPTAAAAGDPLLSAVAPGTRAVQWNQDVVARLPRRARRLATSPDGTVQAARYGARAWGVQFHPETSPEIFASWVADEPEPVPGAPAAVDTERAVRLVREHAAQLRRDWAPLAFRFAACLGAPAQSSA